jgi:ABC-type branched-subunit amino acid transport system permease subunit
LEDVVPGRLAIALCVLLALIAAPLTAAAAPFDPSSSTFALCGMAARKNLGTPGGAAWGHVTFDGVGAVSGGTLTRIDGVPSTSTTDTLVTVIPVRIISDTIAEDPETFTLFLRNPVGARLGDYSAEVMVIKDND